MGPLRSPAPRIPPMPHPRARLSALERDRVHLCQTGMESPPIQLAPEALSLGYVPPAVRLATELSVRRGNQFHPAYISATTCEGDAWRGPVTAPLDMNYRA